MTISNTYLVYERSFHIRRRLQIFPKEEHFILTSLPPQLFEYFISAQKNFYKDFRFVVTDQLEITNMQLKVKTRSMEPKRTSRNKQIILKSFKIACLVPINTLLARNSGSTHLILSTYFKDIIIKDLPQKLQPSKAILSKNPSLIPLQLTLWENYINRSLQFGEAPIKIEKLGSTLRPPTNFTYVSENLYSNGIAKPTGPPPIGCACTVKSKNINNGTNLYTCYSSDSCCPDLSGVQSIYSSQGRLKVLNRRPIFECNSTCSCDSTCHNRVIQKFRRIPLCIFQTENGRGWGVRTDINIDQGTFVMEYMGEVITSKEAEKRGQIYDAEGATYLFDLDFNDSDNVYTIDAKNFGNVSHFVNHSCEPNLEVFPVWIDNLDVNLPHIALFARKFIPTGTELTFDYRMYKKSTPKEKFKGVRCLCGSGKCRKYLC